MAAALVHAAPQAATPPAQVHTGTGVNLDAEDDADAEAELEA